MIMIIWWDFCQATHASGLYGYPHKVFDPIRDFWLHRGASSLVESSPGGWSGSFLVSFTLLDLWKGTGGRWRKDENLKNLVSFLFSLLKTHPPRRSPRRPHTLDEKSPQEETLSSIFLMLKKVQGLPYFSSHHRYGFHGEYQISHGELFFLLVV